MDWLRAKTAKSENNSSKILQGNNKIKWICFVVWGKECTFAKRIYNFTDSYDGKTEQLSWEEGVLY
ncbi:MAG: hypothetical protein II706_08090 [Bacteroidaceae bacterium]|nr:hypothetical protein [Bacteroidaceae bacterium]